MTSKTRLYNHIKHCHLKPVFYSTNTNFPATDHISLLGLFILLGNPNSHRTLTVFSWFLGWYIFFHMNLTQYICHCTPKLHTYIEYTQVTTAALVNSCTAVKFLKNIATQTYILKNQDLFRNLSKLKTRYF